MELQSEEALRILKALASPGRIGILRVLGGGERNISEISRTTGKPQPTVTQNVKQLERAGLVQATMRSVPQGHHKLCARLYDNILIRLPGERASGNDRMVEVSMPVGRFRGFHVVPTCGLVTESEIVGLFDDPQSFVDPRHVFAQLVWFADGHVEYAFPCRVPPGNRVTRLELSAEICAEAPGHDPDHPSDITLWVNGVELGTWRCPGDFGGTRGRLTPGWWDTRYTQFGLLKHWNVTPAGAFLDGSPLSGTTIEHLDLSPGGPIIVRFGIRGDAERKGGINLFGSRFGNYGQDITLKLEFEAVPARQRRRVGS